jgi:acetyltransferase-like isoleucine patch superfamily enzyme
LEKVRFSAKMTKHDISGDDVLIYKAYMIKKGGNSIMITEKEKMLAGKPFKFDEELTKERLFARESIFDFNALRPSETEKRNIIIKKLFGQIGNGFIIRPPFYCDFGYNISIGENFGANCYCIILDVSKVTIGNNVLFGPNVRLFTGGHPIHHETRNTKLGSAFPINIGNNVWIGGGSIVNPGITIEDNTVIGSGSVVTKDIPTNVVAVGNPCRVIREINDEDRQYYHKKLRFEN